MPLQFDSTKCDPPLPADENDSSLRYCLMMASMSTGIPTITAENWPEVYARLHVLEQLWGAYRMAGKKHKPVYFTPADVRRWIGLHTNASPKTRAEFLRSVRGYLDDTIRQVKRDAEK